jgi:L-ribulokinase
MCGVVDGGIVAGRYGYEAGQTGVGDIFACSPTTRHRRRTPPRRPGAG